MQPTLTWPSCLTNRPPSTAEPHGSQRRASPANCGVESFPAAEHRATLQRSAPRESYPAPHAPPISRWSGKLGEVECDRLNPVHSNWMLIRLGVEPRGVTRNQEVKNERVEKWPVNTEFTSIHPPTQLATSYPEWIDPQAGSAIRQGDILAAMGGDLDKWHQMLVVITADCDLANAKHGGALTCLPIIPLTEYLAQFRAEKSKAVLFHRLVGAILSSISGPESNQSGHAISPQRMAAWLEEDSPEQILAALDGWTLGPQVPELMALAQGLTRTQQGDLSSVLSSMAAAKVGLGDARDLSKARHSLATELASTLRSLPGDILMLNEVSAAHVVGYVAYLRRVIEIAEPLVATTYCRIPSETQYVRISRLRSPYIYALTQRFSSVFSSIGLPQAYEEARELIAESIRLGEYL